MTLRLLVPILLLAAALAACGGDDDDDGGGGNGGGETQETATEAAGGGERCVEVWNSEASLNLKAQASLSHRGDTGVADVTVGTYAGEAFSSTGETYDESGSTTSAEITVSPGECVALDLTGSGDSETNWVMVHAGSETGGEPAWYFLDEMGAHPLSGVPQPLKETVKTHIRGLGEEAMLVPE